MTTKLELKYIGIIDKAGKDGLDPLALQLLKTSLESFKINSVSIESLTLTDIKTYLLKIINYIIEKVKEWSENIKKKINSITRTIRNKITDWEMDNRPFKETHPIEITVDNPYLFKGDECLLKSNEEFNVNRLVPNGNYRHFQIFNGMSSLTVSGRGMVECFINKIPFTLGNTYLSNLKTELLELIRPFPENNYGNWGLINFDKDKISQFDYDTRFEEAYRLLEPIRFVTEGNSNNLTLEIDSPDIVITSLKNIKDKISFLEESIKDVEGRIGYFEGHLNEWKKAINNLKDDSDEYKDLLRDFQRSNELHKQFYDIHLKFSGSLAKTFIAAGDVYMKAYKQFRAQ